MGASAESAPEPLKRALWQEQQSEESKDDLNSPSESSEEDQDQRDLASPLARTPPGLEDITNTCFDADSVTTVTELPSIGSKGHDIGTCKRCCFFPKGRCGNGSQCGFCHFDHEKRVRKKRKSRGPAPLDCLPDFEATGSTAPSTPAEGQTLISPGGAAISTPSTCAGLGGPLFSRSVGSVQSGAKAWYEWSGNDCSNGGYDVGYYDYAEVCHSTPWHRLGGEDYGGYFSDFAGTGGLDSEPLEPSSATWFYNEHVPEWTADGSHGGFCTPNWSRAEAVHLHEYAAAGVCEGLHAGVLPPPR